MKRTVTMWYFATAATIAAVAWSIDMVRGKYDLALFQGAILMFDGWMLVRAACGPRPVPPVAINVVNGIVLPLPDDPRWEETHAITGNLKCGPVKVVRTYNAPRTDGGVYVEDRPLAGGDDYARAVLTAWDARTSAETLARQSRAVDAFMNGGET